MSTDTSTRSTPHDEPERRRTRDYRTGKPSRSIQIRWKVRDAQPPSNELGYRDDHEKEQIACLTIGHTKAGIDYFHGRRHDAQFYANVVRESAEDGCFSFILGSGICIHAEAAPRFNEARFLAFEQAALAVLREKFDAGDVFVCPYFDATVDKP